MLNILILYDQYSTHIKTIMEHLEGFSRFSRNNIFYLPATRNSNPQIDLLLFDIVVIHYSVRLSYTWYISPSIADKLNQYQGYKVLFIQDEYEFTEQARKWILELKIHLVYSCVPEEYIALIYPPSRFYNVEFINTLTGFIPAIAYEDRQLRPIQDREFVIGYRARELPVWYGELSHEKYLLGKRMKEICEERGIRASIEWKEEKRIYGDGWYKFLENCRVTLGTESGANVFDEYGEIQFRVKAALAKNRNLSYDDLYSLYVAPYEGKVRMNQISPRIFEAIAMRTGLVLFEGKYSKIVRPNEHYIPLKKDFSNIDDVLNKVLDTKYLSAMADRAYRDIVTSGKYSYEYFVKQFDQVLENRVRPSGRMNIITGVVGWQSDPNSFIQTPRLSRLDDIALDMPLQHFSEEGSIRSRRSIIRFVIDPIYDLFRRNKLFADLVRYLYSIPPIQKFINFLLR